MSLLVNQELGFLWRHREDMADVVDACDCECETLWYWIGCIIANANVTNLIVLYILLQNTQRHTLTRFPLHSIKQDLIFICFPLVGISLDHNRIIGDGMAWHWFLYFNVVVNLKNLIDKARSHCLKESNPIYLTQLPCIYVPTTLWEFIFI